MASKPALSVNPGKGLGFLMLGASLYDVLTRLKAQPHIYPAIDVSYSTSRPISTPVVLTLPYNGLRLRFDGLDQRLRLIEVLDFTKTPLTYKDNDVIKIQEGKEPVLMGHNSLNPTGPVFRQVYHKLFGPTFAGEYLKPTEGSKFSPGVYILSYPGVAFAFPLENVAWPGEADFIKLLSSSAASPAKSLTIFNGASWPEARKELYTRPCPFPRSLALAGKGRDGCPDEIELAKVRGNGRITMYRRSSAPFQLVLSETTPQDLVAELGPPDAIYQKNDQRLSIHKTHIEGSSDRVHPYGLPGQFDSASDTDRSPVIAASDDSDPGDDIIHERNEKSTTECFYNYFHHGFDIFVSYPSKPSPGLRPSQSGRDEASSVPSTNHFVATKIHLHANIPGSYPFNRYRRSRWVLDPEQIIGADSDLDSETPFRKLSSALRQIWKNSYTSAEEEARSQRPMALNRGWGDSPGSSCELLGGWEESADLSKKGTEGTVSDGGTSLGSTQLIGFPGLLFEVLKNDAVSCLTVY